jgi:hypothetical protein
LVKKSEENDVYLLVADSLAISEAHLQDYN